MPIVPVQIEQVELTTWGTSGCGGQNIYVEITHGDSTCQTGKSPGFSGRDILLWSKTPTDDRATQNVWLNGIYRVLKRTNPPCLTTLPPASILHEHQTFDLKVQKFEKLPVLCF